MRKRKKLDYFLSSCSLGGVSIAAEPVLAMNTSIYE
jgi:hypothetical protein